ncbi:MAG TPA: hypothetical protein VFB13_05615 [Reyranella sp.]|jgi:hypothetical protein|nr:hypothetical protein [Reyranella sp.]
MATGPTSSAPRPSKSRQRVLRGSLTPEQTRIFLYLLFAMVQRIDGQRREVFGGDLDLASILHAVSESTIEGLMRDPDWRGRHGDLSKVVGATGQRGINTLSISQATGIPRETARRKIKKLIAMGALTDTGRNEFILTPGYLQRVMTPQRFDKLMADTVRFFNEALAAGVYTWSDSQE